MNSEHHEIIRDIAEALYRSTGAFPTYFTSEDVRNAAGHPDIATELSEADCASILDSMTANFYPHIETAIDIYRDTKQDVAHSVTTLLTDIRLKLAELEGSFSITEGAKP